MENNQSKSMQVKNNQIRSVQQNNTQIQDDNRNMNKKETENTMDTYDYLGNAASISDCTGLIPVGECREKELETYREIYQFGVPTLERTPDKK